ncbi:hypothetical protein LMG23994_07040 [Cupriavidus pinatubonensis]|uniref:Uncharacterized protein n=1 Tax=Cupriavidus pinatubonensis TaxID=248026 RepID=A0ABM8Y481_9BURK|nr:hypothetical protein LMG23994_07040 [Cupriavidus pinatubonensis]
MLRWQQPGRAQNPGQAAAACESPFRWRERPPLPGQGRRQRLAPPLLQWLRARRNNRRQSRWSRLPNICPHAPRPFRRGHSPGPQVRQSCLAGAEYRGFGWPRQLFNIAQQRCMVRFGDALQSCCQPPEDGTQRTLSRCVWQIDQVVLARCAATRRSMGKSSVAYGWMFHLRNGRYAGHKLVAVAAAQMRKGVGTNEFRGRRMPPSSSGSAMFRTAKNGHDWVPHRWLAAVGQCNSAIAKEREESQRFCGMGRR